MRDPRILQEKEQLRAALFPLFSLSKNDEIEWRINADNDKISLYGFF